VFLRVTGKIGMSENIPGEYFWDTGMAQEWEGVGVSRIERGQEPIVGQPQGRC